MQRVIAQPNKQTLSDIGMLSPVNSTEGKVGGYKFRHDCDVETVVTLWLITQDKN